MAHEGKLHARIMIAPLLYCEVDPTPALAHVVLSFWGVHDAFATIWWDADADRYRMRAHLANGQAVDAEPVVSADTLVWGFRHPHAGQIRYTITRTADGDWHEIGERSSDGRTNWMRIIKMRLTKSAIAP